MRKKYWKGCKMNLEEAKEKYNIHKGKQEYIERQIEEGKIKIKSLNEDFEIYSKARIVFVEVSNQTKESFKEKVESLITMAINSVFERDFAFELKFEEKRNKIECTPIVKENGNEYTPKEDMGGGILDIIGFAFKIVLWALEEPKSRNLLYLDEPMRFLGKLNIRGAQMIKEISEKLNVQVIMNTHDDAMIEIADSSYSVSHNGVKSKVVKVK